MPNQPGQDTVTVSFTLPRTLDDAVERRAKEEMTNKSDIIRRALMNHLSPQERAIVIAAQKKNSRYPESRHVSEVRGVSSKVASVAASSADDALAVALDPSRSSSRSHAAAAPSAHKHKPASAAAKGTKK